MAHIRKFITFITLMVLALNASAEMNKCTDSNGKITYTNMACPPGYEVTNSIADNSVAAEGNPSFTQQELDQMLAPIALYPDPLLSQMLMAATYPLEVVEAARWSNANPILTGRFGGSGCKRPELGCERQIAARIPAGAANHGPIY